MKRKQLCVLVASLLMTSAFMDVALAAPVIPQTTAFSYQGQLNAGGVFPTGQYQFTFTLYDSAAGGAAVGGTLPIQQSLQVINGLFTTDLDFGQVFNGTQYWLDIKVGTLVTNEEELLARQPIDVVPVAQYALNSPAGTAGPTGATGPQGPAGAQGATGADGVQGPQGGQGGQGTQGLQGPQGQAGQTGDTGTQGPQGATGIDGSQGPQGSIGPTGATGLTWQGTWNDTETYAVDDAVFFGGSSYIALNANSGDEPDTSVTAADGNWALLAQQGAAGASGAQGPSGAAGLQGPQGDQGPQGPQGFAGVQGGTGPQGAQGDVGAQGPQGDVGVQGPQGADGIAGTQGAQGATGAPASGFAFSDIIPGNTAVGEGTSNWLTQNGANGTEGNAIYIVPAACSSQTLRVVIQSNPLFTYTFALRRYAGPNNASGTGTTVTSCSISGTNKTCTAPTGATAFAAGDGYSTLITGNAFLSTAGAIAVSVRCQ